MPLLTSCETVKFLERSTTVSSSAFTCPDFPPVPQQGATDNEIAEYILGLAIVGKACKHELEVELPEDLTELGVIIE